MRTTNRTSLYYGDNEHQEFWESEDGETLILRRKAEAPGSWVCVKLTGEWTPIDKTRQAKAEKGVTYCLSGATPERITRLIHRQYSKPVILDRTRHWAWPGKVGTFPMRLTATD